MAENENACGQFYISGTELTGYRAPDEDKNLVRPVLRRESWRILYDRSETGWQPVRVEIPRGITSIGRSAFEACYGLESVVIPDTVVSIGQKAFCNCTSLTTVHIPGSVKEVHNSAFFRCSSLRDLTISNGVETIGIGAFSCCDALTRVSLPDSIVHLELSAFSKCFGLREITIPEILQDQAGHAFGHMFQLFWRWLCGTLQVNAPMEDMLASAVRCCRTKVWKKIVSQGNVEVLERYVNAWDLMPLEYLDKRIERSQKANKPEYTEVLLRYRRESTIRTSRGQKSPVLLGVQEGRNEHGRRGDCQRAVQYLL